MSRGRKIGLGVLAGVVVAVALVYTQWVVPTRYGVAIGTAMLAKQVCSCVYIANRSVADCRADQFATMDAIELEVLREQERVRAWVPGFGERTAAHREGFGCALE